MSLKLSSVGEKVLGRSLFGGLAGGANGEGSGAGKSPLLSTGFSSFISEYEGFSNVVLGFNFRLNKLHFDS